MPLLRLLELAVAVVQLGAALGELALRHLPERVDLVLRVGVTSVCVLCVWWGVFCCWRRRQQRRRPLRHTTIHKLHHRPPPPNSLNTTTTTPKLNYARARAACSCGTPPRGPSRAPRRRSSAPARRSTRPRRRRRRRRRPPPPLPCRRHPCPCPPSCRPFSWRCPVCLFVFCSVCACARVKRVCGRAFASGSPAATCLLPQPHTLKPPPLLPCAPCRPRPSPPPPPYFSAAFQPLLTEPLYASAGRLHAIGRLIQP